MRNDGCCRRHQENPSEHCLPSCPTGFARCFTTIINVVTDLYDIARCSFAQLSFRIRITNLWAVTRTVAVAIGVYLDQAAG